MRCIEVLWSDKDRLQQISHEVTELLDMTFEPSLGKMGPWEDSLLVGTSSYCSGYSILGGTQAS